LGGSVKLMPRDCRPRSHSGGFSSHLKRPSMRDTRELRDPPTPPPRQRHRPPNECVSSGLSALFCGSKQKEKEETGGKWIPWPEFSLTSRRRIVAINSGNRRWKKADDERRREGERSGRKRDQEAWPFCFPFTCMLASDGAVSYRPRRKERQWPEGEREEGRRSQTHR